MVIDPTHDPKGHAAVTLDDENGDLVHAFVMKYPDGQPQPSTECGEHLDGMDPMKDPNAREGPLGEFDLNELDLCSQCWVDGLLD